MTRWARYTVQKKAAHEASSWKDLKSKKHTPCESSPDKDYVTRHASVQQDKSLQLKAAEHTAVKKDKRRENRRIKRIRNKESKMVCFHCRMSGHGMADCPILQDDVEQGTDICFKCGSTEHKSNVCTAKVSQGKPFMFAKCFVCGETGHLSKSCPDNPRGLYPDGGCCQLCGSVEHYRKDCPDRRVKNEVTAYRFKPAALSGSKTAIGKRSLVHVSVDDELSLYEDQTPVKAPVKKKVKVVSF